MKVARRTALMRRWLMAALAAAVLGVVSPLASYGQAGSPPPTVDVLVVYSPAALASYQTEGAIAQAVSAEMTAVNGVFANSGVQARVNLVGLDQVPFAVYTTMAHAVTAANMSRLDIKNLRDETRADIVLLMTVGQLGCYGSPGMPGYDLRQADDGFVSVINGTCGFGAAIGRMLGLGSFPGSSDAARPYGYGFVGFPGEPFGPIATFMAEEFCIGCQRASRLSDPALLLQGITMGDAAAAHERRAIVEAAPLVSAYRGCTHSTSGAVTVTANPDGSDHSFQVTTEVGCATGIPDALPAWLSVVSATPLSHTGPATVTLRATTNGDFVPRSTIVTIGKQKVTITQAPSAGGACPTIEYASPSVAVDGDANAFAFSYRAPDGCRVFRRFDSVQSGQPSTTYHDTGLRGFGDIWAPGRLPIEPSVLSYSETVVVELAGVPLNVQQGPASCRPRRFTTRAITPTVAGGHDTLRIDLPSACGWTIANVPSWMSVTGPPNGSGSADVSLQIAANPGAPRSASIGITTATGTMPVLVMQPGTTCQPTFSGVTSPAFPAAGGSTQVEIVFGTMEQACAWAIDTLPSWVTAEPMSGTGTTSLTFTATANTGAARDELLLLGGVTISLGQHAALCAASFSGLPTLMPATGGHATVEVTTRDGCPWANGPHSSWLGAPFEISGTGNTSFVVVAHPNTGYDRETTFSVGGGSTPVVVRQPGPLGASGTTGCASFSLSATTLSRDGQTVRASVREVTPGCGWNVSTDAQWLVPLPPFPQVFDAEFDVGVRPNPTAAARTGSMTIGGETIVVTQAPGIGCTYFVLPTDVLPAGGGSADVMVATAADCAWTVPVSVEPWLTIADAGTLRSGTASFTVSAGVNTTNLPRSFTASINGVEMRVGQSANAACAVTLDETAAFLPPSGGQVLRPVTVAGGCTWSVTSLSLGMTVVGASSGQGSGSVTVNVPPHTDLFGQSISFSVNERPIIVVQGAYVPYAATRRYLAEGATGAFFDTNIAMFNPYVDPINATLTFLRSGHAPLTTVVTLPPRGRADVRPAEQPGLAAAEFSTVIDTDAPIAIDRTMTWDASGYGSHTEAAIVSPALTWYLAEGATSGAFNLFYLLQNPAADPALVRVTYLLGGGQPPLEKVYTVAAQSRQNIWVDVEMFPTPDGSLPLLASAEVSGVIEVLNDVPIIVERAMYMDRPGQLFSAGHNSAGVTAPDTNWFLAEGATGAYFDMFVLLANPTQDDAVVTVDYLRVDGSPLQKTYTVPASSRFNIWVDEEEFDGLGRALADATFSMTLTSTNGTPIIVERSMWWPGNSTTWHEAHNSPGATATGTRWAIAGGDHRPAEGRETYLLVANTSDYPATVTARFAFGGASRFEMLVLPPKSRGNLPVPVVNAPASSRFGVVVESIDNGNGQIANIVVETAQYRDVGGVRWQAGGNALATRLP